MANLSRLQEHLRKREWVHLDREAARLHMIERLSSRESGQVLRAWGRAKIGLNDFHAAIDLMERAIPHALKAKDWDCLGFLRSDLGGAYTAVGDVEAGVDQLKAYLLDTSRYSTAREQHGKVLFNLALAHRYKRRYPEAIAQYEAAIDWSTLHGHTREKAMAHQNLAWLYCTIGQPIEARCHLEVADTFREVLSPSFDAEQICCWAIYYWTVGDIGHAIDCAQEILLADRPGVDAHHRGQAAVISGRIAVLVGWERQARLCLNAAIEAAVEAEDPPLANDCSALRAAIQTKWGNQEAAQ